MDTADDILNHLQHRKLKQLFREMLHNIRNDTRFNQPATPTTNEPQPAPNIPKPTYARKPKKNKQDILSAEELRERLHYNRDTGEFTRRNNPNAKPTLGTQTGEYRSFCIKGYTYPAHRLAWLHVYGEWPSYGILVDHINGVKHDNRIANLRLATPAQNSWNVHPVATPLNPYKGVHWDEKHQCWIGSIDRTPIGYFDTAEDARDAVFETLPEWHAP